VVGPRGAALRRAGTRGFGPDRGGRCTHGCVGSTGAAGAQVGGPNGGGRYMIGLTGAAGAW